MTAQSLHSAFQQRNSYRRMESVPDNFKRIGEGAYRTVFLDEESGIVYKVGNYKCNVSEAAAARKLAKRSTKELSFDLRIPRTRTFRMPSDATDRYGHKIPQCVVAQEFVKGAVETWCDLSSYGHDNPECSCQRHGECFADILTEIEEWSGLFDIHSENVLMDENGVFWIVDLAC